MPSRFFLNHCFCPFAPLGSMQTASLLSGSHDPLSSPCNVRRIMAAEADQNNIFGGFGAVLGYVGGEAATVEWFDRLLWPQRFFSGFRLASVPSVALLLPMGGPLHKAALTALDKMYSHGLLKGAHRGHMLGTPFFRSLDWTYTMHGDAKDKTHTEPLRNCLWARAIALLPVGEHLSTTGSGDEEKNEQPKTVFRAYVAVNHLTLSAPTAAEKKKGRLPFVSEPADTPTLQVFLGIVTAEATAVFLALAQALAWHTTWALLFLVPLFLRLLSATLALQREKLMSTISIAVADRPLDFEVQCPQSDGSFMLLTGPPALVLQFVRHFGHPVRNQGRELIQVACVAAFAAFYPLSLLCSMVWMPLHVQCVWLSYQMYLVAAMHVARFVQSGLGATTEARIAEALRLQDARSDTKGGASILFGHQLDGEGTIKATWSATYHTRNLEGKKAMEALLKRSQSAPVVSKDIRRPPGPRRDSKASQKTLPPQLPHSDSTDSDVTLVEDISTSPEPRAHDERT